MKKLFLVILFIIVLAELLSIAFVAGIIGWGSVIFVLFIQVIVGITLIQKGVMARHSALDSMEQRNQNFLKFCISGILLIIPGFFTDVLGLMIWIPKIRSFFATNIFPWVMGKFVNGNLSGFKNMYSDSSYNNRSNNSYRYGGNDDEVIEAEYTEKK